MALSDTNIGSELTLPDLTECHMTIEIKPSESHQSLPSASWQNFIASVHPKSPIYPAKVISNTVLTTKDSVKQCYDLKFRINDESSAIFEYEPGHAIDLVVANSDLEVDAFLKKLNLEKSRF